MLASAASSLDSFALARAWFVSLGFAPFPFQEEVWAAYAARESGLVHAPTGMGKTYAAAIGPIALGHRGSADAPPRMRLHRSRSCGSRRCAHSPATRVQP